MLYSSELPKSKYGLPEFRFEIGSMDDYSETVAIVGQEYSDVDSRDVFHSQEDVEAYIAETEEQHKHEVSLLLLQLAEKDKEIEKWKAARDECERQFQEKVEEISGLISEVNDFKVKYRDCKRELDLLKDTQAFYRGKE
jgi:chromosome segregation ATPase